MACAASRQAGDERARGRALDAAISREHAESARNSSMILTPAAKPAALEGGDATTWRPLSAVLHSLPLGVGLSLPVDAPPPRPLPTPAPGTLTLTLGNVVNWDSSYVHGAPALRLSPYGFIGLACHHPPSGPLLGA